jgi:hypothetical protein
MADLRQFIEEEAEEAEGSDDDDNYNDDFLNDPRKIKDR